MSRCRSSSGSSGRRRGPNSSSSAGRKQIADFRRAIFPLIGHLLGMMAEIGEIELETSHPASGARSCASRRGGSAARRAPGPSPCIRRRNGESRDTGSAPDRRCRASAENRPAPRCRCRSPGRHPRPRWQSRRNRRPRRRPPPRTAKRGTPRIDARDGARYCGTRRESCHREMPRRGARESAAACGGSADAPAPGPYWED